MGYLLKLILCSFKSGDIFYWFILQSREAAVGWNQIQKYLEKLIFFIMPCFNFAQISLPFKGKWNLNKESYAQNQFVWSGAWTFFRVFMFTTHTDSVYPHKQLSKLAQVWILQDRKNSPTLDMKLQKIILFPKARNANYLFIFCFPK